MPKPTAHEALIYLMVITSASDRDMTDVELKRIGDVVRTWPAFIDFDEGDIVSVARDCQALLHEEAGMDGVMALAARVIPTHMHDTAYAAAVEVATVDLEMRMEEMRILQLLHRHLEIDDETVEAIERACKARHRMLT